MKPIFVFWFLLAFVVVMTLASIDDIQTKRICEAFRANGDKISFVFINYGGIFNIVINGQFWAFKYLQLFENKFKYLQEQSGFELIKAMSGENSLFSGPYTSAACLEMEGDKKYKCNPFLFNFTDGKVLKASIKDYDFQSSQSLSEYKNRDEFRIVGLSKKSLIVFQYESQKVFVVEKTDKYDVMCYDFNLINPNIKVIYTAKTEPNINVDSLKGIPSHFDLIGVVPRYIGGINGVFLFFKKDASLQYCWTPSDSFLSSCKNPMTLIDCSQISIPTTATTTTTATTATIAATTTTAMTTTTTPILPVVEIKSHFCDAFNRNDDKISYVFNTPGNVSQIVINGQFWGLKYLQQTNSLEFMGNDMSGENSLFSDKYSSAACLEFKKDLKYHCNPFLFNFIDEKVIKAFKEDYDFEKPLPLSEYKKSKEFDIFQLDSKPYIVFQYVDRFPEKQVFVVQKTSDKYDLKAYEFEIDEDSIWAKPPDQESAEDSNNIKTFKEIPSEFDLIGALPQWRVDKQEYGIILLFKKDATLQYCWTNLVSFGEVCKNPKNLINCSQISTPTITSPAISTTIKTLDPLEDSEEESEEDLLPFIPEDPKLIPTYGPSLCDTKYEEGLKIISLFNLDNDLLIHTRDSSATIDFWRLKTNLGPNRAKRIPNTENMKVLIHLSNNIKETIDSNDFDTTKRMRGHVVPQKIDWLISCGQTHINWENRNDSCVELLSTNDLPFIRFVCIHGVDKKGNDLMEAFKYNSLNGTLENLMNSTLKQMFRNNCISVEHSTDDITEESVLAFISEPVNPPTDYNHIMVKEIDVLYVGKLKKMVKIFVKSGKTVDMSMSYPKKSVYFVFKFSDYHKYYSCGEDCSLNSTLVWIDPKASKPNDFIRQEPFSLKVLLGCPYHRIKPFDPNYFCNQNQNFISIFNLGEDIYFQSSGRFWRYDHNGFTRFKDKPSFKSTPIRFDSDMTGFLERESFDTLHPIISFAFHAKTYDFCGENDNECNQKYFSSNEYFRVCLIGRNIDSNVVSEAPYLNVYHYTPSGLKKFQTKSLFDKTLKFCSDFYKKLKEIRDLKLLSINSNIYLKSKMETPNGLVLLEGKSSDDVFLTFQSDETLSSVTFKDIPIKGNKQRVKFIFNAYRGIWGYGKESNGNLYSFLYVSSPESFEETSSTTIQKLFNCPFNRSASVLTARRQRFCEDREYDVSESVFNIGGRVYHQIGRYFYAIDGKKFRFDRYSTNLFNRFFNTRHRLTGASMRVKDTNIYEVIIFGKTSLRFKDFGDSMFAMFSFNESMVSILKPIYDGIVSVFKPTVTFGVKILWPSVKLTHSMANYYSLPNSEVKQNLFIIFETFIRYNPLKHMKESVFYLHSTQTESEFTFMFEKKYERQLWQHLTSDFKIRYFDDIIGVYLKPNASHLYLVATNKTSPKNLVEFQMTQKGEDGKEELISGKHVWNLLEKNDYTNNYCKKEEELSSESSSAPNTLVNILAILLIILLILALVLSFKNILKSETKEKSPKVEKMDANEPNSGVVGPPQQNPNKSGDNQNVGKEVDNNSDESVRTERSE